ncbi:hypothetical protein [Nostoc sp. C052]|uniref:hypothetical protein n=1 Tax=Nostoc sp. C052 TaxID=2576902 RepID=UPI0021188FD1|nr:hypothetical protein [Nostoc sp. C052]
MPTYLTGFFYQSSIKITLEENIADISIEDEDTNIKGRMDILAVSKTQKRIVTTPFWILVIESKNSSFNALERLSQLLTYAYKSLENQTSVWGVLLTVWITSLSICSKGILLCINYCQN